VPSYGIWIDQQRQTGGHSTAVERQPDLAQEVEFGAEAGRRTSSSAAA
jgi:hypothetical protein